MKINIEEMLKKDWVQVSTIYGQGLATGIAAFMTTHSRWKDWNAGHLEICRNVARDDSGMVLGWSALAPVADN